MNSLNLWMRIEMVKFLLWNGFKLYNLKLKGLKKNREGLKLEEV